MRTRYGVFLPREDKIYNTVLLSMLSNSIYVHFRGVYCNWNTVSCIINIPTMLSIALSLVWQMQSFLWVQNLIIFYLVILFITSCYIRWCWNFNTVSLKFAPYIPQFHMKIKVRYVFLSVHCLVMPYFCYYNILIWLKILSIKTECI